MNVSAIGGGYNPQVETAGSLAYKERPELAGILAFGGGTETAGSLACGSSGGGLNVLA